MLYGDNSAFPQLWCPEGTYSAYGILFFKPIDEVLSLMIQFEVSKEDVMLKIFGCKIKLYIPVCGSILLICICTSHA